MKICSFLKTYFQCLFLQEPSWRANPHLSLRVSPASCAWAVLLAHLSSWGIVICSYTCLLYQYNRVHKSRIGLFFMVAPKATILFNWISEWTFLSSKTSKVFLRLNSAITLHWLLRPSTHPLSTYTFFHTPSQRAMSTSISTHHGERVVSPKVIHLLAQQLLSAS